MRRRNSIIIASLFFLLALTAIILFLRSNYFYKKIELGVIPLLEDAIGRKIIYSDSHVNFYPFYWELNNAGLRDKKTGDTLLKAKNVRVYLSLSRLGQKRLMIKDIRLNEPVFSAIRYTEGRTNLEGLFPPRKPTAWVVTIDRIDINNGLIQYDDRLARRDITLEKIDGKIIPDFFKKEIGGDLTSEGAYKDERIYLQGLKIKGDFSVDIRDRMIKAVSVKRLDITSPSESKLEGKGVINGDDSIDLNGKVVLSLMDLSMYIHGYIHDKRELQGKMIFTGGVKGSFAKPEIDGGITIDNLTYERIRYGNIKGNLSYKEDLLSLSNFKSEILKGRIEGNIEISRKEDISSYHLLLKVTDLQPYDLISRYVQGLKEKLVKDGEINGEIEVRGNIIGKETIEGKGWLTYGDSNQSFYLSGGIKKGLNISAGISGELSDIANYLHIPHFPLHGLANLTGEISGTVDKPDVSGVITMPGGIVKDVIFDSVTADLRLYEETLYLQSVTLRRDDAVYNMSGNIKFRASGFKNPYFDLTGDIKQVSPKDIVSIFYQVLPLDIKTDGQIMFNGDIRDFQFVAELSGAKGSIYRQTFDGGHILLSLTRNRVIFDRITMVREKDIVTGNGWIGFGGELKGEFYADIGSEEFSLQNVDLLKDKLSFLKGESAFKMKGSGKLIDPVIEATVDISHLFVKEVDTGHARLTVSKDREEMGIRGEAMDVRYDGNILWRREPTFTMNIHLVENTLHPILALLRPSIAEEISINATGEVTIRGGLKDLETLNASILLSHVTGLYSDYRVENDGDVRLSFEDYKLTFDSVRFKGEGTSLGIIGSLIPNGDTNIFVNGEADLRLLTLLTPEIKYSKGKAFLAFLISGEMENPSIQGGMAVKDGTMRSATLKQTIEGASISIFFNGQEIVLESLQGVVGGGTVNGSGKVEIREFEIKEFGFILEIANTLFRYPEGLDSRIDGTFIFQGTPKSKGLKGEIRIKKASYEKNLNIRSLILELQRKKARIEQPVPFFGNTELNIHISGKKDIWINNNLAKLPVEVDLIIKGTLDHPLIFGRIEAQDGTFVFSGNPFKVISATADFISPDTVRPVLDIHATTETRRYRIDLRLSGTVDRFNLSLSSEPPLSDTDILALLTVGQMASEVAETMREVGAVEATAFLAAPIQERIEVTLQDIIKIDRFQVDPYYSTSAASGGARLTVGKRLLDDKLYVTYTTGITTVEELIKLEYFLGRNVYIVGERDEQGRMSGDIKFRFEFK